MFATALRGNDWEGVDIILKNAQKNEELLKLCYGIDGRRTKQLPLDYSCIKNHIETVGVLLKHGADPRPADEKGPIYHAIDQGHEDIFKLLLRKVDPNCIDFKVESFLESAITRGHKVIVKLLIKKIDTNLSNINVENILIRTIAHGRSEMLEFLLGLKEIDLNEFPLNNILSSGIDNADILHILLEKCEINLTDYKGENILFNFVSTLSDYDTDDSQRIESFKVLIEVGKVNVNFTDNEGQSILHKVVLKNQMEMVKYLFANTDSNFNAVDKNGKTAMQLSMTIEMAKLLNKLVQVYKKEEEPTKKAEVTKLEAIDKDIECSKKKIFKIDREIEQIDVKITKLNERKEQKISVEKPAIENELKEKLAKKESYLQEPPAKNIKQKDGANWNKCPICSEVMELPKTVYQCAEGHYFCSDCRPSLTMCPICRMDITGLNIRSRAMEKLIENGGTM